MSEPHTCRAGPVLVGGLAGLAVANPVHRQDSESVVDVRREAELRRGDGAGHLRHIHPHPRLVEEILELD